MSEMSETLGQRLKAERERKGLSPQKAADALHLDGWVIDALESGDYAPVGPSVYVKGHLKRYAALIGLPAAEMLEAYDSQSSAPLAAAKAVTMRLRTSTPAGSEFPWVGIAGFAVVALGVAGVLWRKPWHPHTAAAPAVVAANSNAAAASAESAADRGVQPNGVEGAAGEGERLADRGALDGSAPAAAIPAGTGAAAVATPNLAANSDHGAAPGPAATPDHRAVAGSQTPAAVGQSDTDPMSGVGRARLRLRFSADSWVDVHDALGRRVFAGNGRANSVKVIAGTAPLRVYLRSASGVQLEINNRAVAIGPRFVTGEVARFEAGADGVLRQDPHAPSANGATTAAQRPRG